MRINLFNNLLHFTRAFYISLSFSVGFEIFSRGVEVENFFWVKLEDYGDIYI